ncbi:MAG TPA: amidohydrolase family protein [Chitinivibrionales bacterium]|jgi:cytosine/adenosine deaminase-related metal-dependent hydrolase|nr:amidohydrolase family protein [Chitinivibrionales bacterium]
MATIYFAKWVLLPSFEVLHNAAVSVENGRIQSAGPRGWAKHGDHDRIVNLGDMFLLPGLINIHTHLEENALRDMPRAENETFASWTAKRGTRLRHCSDNAIENAVRLATREMLSCGITTVADSSRRGISGRVLAQEPIRSYVLHEVHPETAEEEQGTVAALSGRIGPSAQHEATGIGPYSVYSLSPDAHAALAEFGRRNGYLWSCHIAESAEELQAFSDQTGDLYFQMTRRKPWPFGRVTTGSMDCALSENLIPPGAICYHCNYVNGQELSRLAELGASIVLCFQYSREAGHKAFPLDAAINRGALLCAATESLSMERSMNLFDELFCARRAYPHVPAADMLRWITSNPAAALGASSQIGSLAAGLRADVVGLRFPQKPGADLLEELIMGEPEARLVVVNGEEIIADY